MAVAREALAVGDVEAQVVALVRGWLFVEVEEDDKGHGAPDGDGDVGIGGHGHLQTPAPHDHTLVAGEDQLRSLRLVDEDGDGTEVRALFLVAVWRSRGPNQLSVHRHTSKAKGKRAEVRQTAPTAT